MRWLSASGGDISFRIESKWQRSAAPSPAAVASALAAETAAVAVAQAEAARVREISEEKEQKNGFTGRSRYCHSSLAFLGFATVNHFFLYLCLRTSHLLFLRVLLQVHLPSCAV
jgi:transcriptional regulator of nitric oxide reductase